MPRSGSGTPGGEGEGKHGSAVGRVAVLVGFPEGLERALSGLLESRQLSVHRCQGVSDVIELLRATRADLVVVSSRCSAAAVVDLTERLGQPRRTRVIVLLAGRDPEAERGYRAGGLEYVMTMPVHADDLLRVAFPRPA
jgi:DNA-binding NtrC family response regulator